MKQVFQNYKSGELQLAEVPAPQLKPHTLLVRTVASLISVGTERSMIELGKKSLLGKTRARPDQLKLFINKTKNEGF